MISDCLNFLKFCFISTQISHRGVLILYKFTSSKVELSSSQPDQFVQFSGLFKQYLRKYRPIKAAKLLSDKKKYKIVSRF